MLDELNAQGSSTASAVLVGVLIISFQSANTRCPFYSSPFLYQSQLLFAASPLIALAYVLMSAFESEEAEGKKRKKKTDFQMDGHSE
jgi:hypothetical protein